MNASDRFTAWTPTDITEIEYRDLAVIANTSMISSLIDQLLYKIVQHTVYALVEFDKAGLIQAADIVALNPGTEAMRGNLDLGGSNMERSPFYRKVDHSDPKEIHRLRELASSSLGKLLRLYLTYGTVYYRIMLKYDIIIGDYTVYPVFADKNSCSHDLIYTIENAKTQFRLINNATLESLIEPVGVPLTGWHAIVSADTTPFADIFDRSEQLVWRKSHVARAAPIVMAIVERLYISNIGAINASMTPDKILRDTMEDMSGARIESMNLNGIEPEDRTRANMLTVVAPVKDTTIQNRSDIKQNLTRLQRMINITTPNMVYRLPKNTDRIGPDRITHVDDFQTTMEVYHRHLTMVFAQAPNILIPRAPNHNKSTQSRGRDASDEQGDVQVYIDIVNFFYDSFEKVYARVKTNTYPISEAPPPPIKYGICLYFKGMLDLSDRIRLTGGLTSIEMEIELRRAIINARTQTEVAKIQADASITISKSKLASDAAKAKQSSATDSTPKKKRKVEST